MNKALFAVAAAALAASSCSSCHRPEDMAAKERIFSPEEPPGTSAQAHESIDPRKLADDLTEAQRVLHMTRAEIAERLGQHQAKTQVQFAWFRGPGIPDGGAEIQLSEQGALVQGPKGDFSARLENDHHQGFEMVWAGGEAYVKTQASPFRKRRTDRSDPPRFREQATAACATFDTLARGLQLRLASETTADGRRAIRYVVAGTGARPPAPDSRELPALQYPEPPPGQAMPQGKGPRGPDRDTARRLELWEKVQPVEVTGGVLVDAQTSALLACDLQGHFRVAGDGKRDPAAELDLHAVLATEGVGKPQKVSAPAFEPDQTVAHAVKDPLRFWGKAGAAARPSGEEGVVDEEAAPDEEEATTPPSAEDDEEPAAPKPAATPRPPPPARKDGKP